MFTKELADIGTVMEAAAPYAESEKTCVHHFALNNPNIIDLEIAFPTGGSRKQIDFVSFQNTSRGTEINFFEAKMIVNPELRASGSGAPRVIDQIQTYTDLLRTNQEEIIESYRQICSNFAKLRGRIRCPKVHEMSMRGQFESIAHREKLIVNCAPRLVVFVPTDHEPDENWEFHRDKLVNHPQLAEPVVFWSVPRRWILT